MAMVVVMMIPAMAMMAVPMPMVRRRAVCAGPHTVLVASAAGLVGDLGAAADIDGEVRVGPDVAEMHRARLADAGGDAAVAAVAALIVTRRGYWLPGLLDLARR
jgi:hypothetical protein